MRNDPLQPHVRSLLTERVESVTQLDILLLAHSGRSRNWTPGEVASELRIGAPWADEQLQLLVRYGFLARDPHGSYRYAPNPDLAPAVDDLAHAYGTTPVAVVAAIYSKPSQKLKNFANAFRLRPPPPLDPTPPPIAPGTEGDPSHG